MFSPTLQPSLQDRVDYENADRGLIASLAPCLVKNEAGQTVWNNEDHNFLEEDCPATVNPNLWRQGQLTRKHGLFEVTKGVYQVRGFDLSNMTLIEGQTGVIVLDVLASTECAAAALSFYREHRGQRSVQAVIYSHSHYDHFGGAQGVLSIASVGDEEHDVPGIAPAGFMDAVLKENIVAGPAMRRRAVFMFGGSLPIGPKAHVGCGTGMAASSGTTTIVPPTDTINETGDERTIDGVKMIFQMVPDTEAPCDSTSSSRTSAPSTSPSAQPTQCTTSSQERDVRYYRQREDRPRAENCTRRHADADCSVGIGEHFIIDGGVECKCQSISFSVQGSVDRNKRRVNTVIIRRR